MTKADRIREHVLSTIVEPARRSGVAEVKVRAGDVHRAMGLQNSLPAVCGALGTNKFELVARVTTVSRSGPSNGANAEFHFRVQR